MAGLVGVVTSVLTGSAFALLAALVFGHSLVAAVAAGGVTGIAALAAMMRYQRLAWARALAAPLIVSEVPAPR